MKRIKTAKGITLVALIITIIVLLILAVVAIQAVVGDGIIGHAKDAADQYQTQADEENATLQGYGAMLDGLGQSKKTLKLTVLSNNAVPVQFEFEEGMTWVEFVLSPYSRGLMRLVSQGERYVSVAVDTSVENNPLGDWTLAGGSTFGSGAIVDPYSVIDPSICYFFTGG